MLTHLPAIAAIYAAILGILGAILTVQVIVNRARLKIINGDGGNPQMAQAIRAHGNFTEQVPLAVLLLVLAEALGAAPMVVHGIGVVLVVARVLSAIGLSRSQALTMPRQSGAGLTILSVVAASATVLYLTLAH